jgi:hypothetical protein
MNQEQTPRSQEVLLTERERVLTALRLKEEQTAANIAAGVIKEGDPDEDKEALEAELESIEAELTALGVDAHDAGMQAAKQVPLGGIS